MDFLDYFVLLNIFKYVEPFEYQILKLCCRNFCLLINSNDSMWLDYLETLFDCKPFEWIDEIPFNQRTSILKWIIFDLNLLKKLEPKNLLHYPTDKTLLPKIDELIPKTDDYQYQNLYSHSLVDANLKEISDHCFYKINLKRKRNLRSCKAWNLRHDLLVTSDEPFNEQLENEILEKLAKQGTPSDFDKWFHYFDKISSNDLKEFANAKNMQNELYMHKNNVNFMIFLHCLGKLGVVNFYRLMQSLNFDSLDYLMNTFPDITQSGINYSNCSVIDPISHYKGKNGLKLYQWVLPVLKNQLHNQSLLKDIIITFGNFKLMQKIIENAPQLDYAGYSYYRIITSKKVLEYCITHLNYQVNLDNFCDIRSIGALIYLLKKGTTFSFNFYSRMPITNCKNLLKTSSFKLETYFHLLFEMSKSFARNVCSRYLMTLIDQQSDCGTTEEGFFKVCKAIPDLKSIIDNNLTSKLKVVRYYHVITWMHKNNHYDFSKEYGSLFMGFNFQQWKNRFTPEQSKSNNLDPNFAILEQILNDLNGSLSH